MSNELKDKVELLARTVAERNEHCRAFLSVNTPADVETRIKLSARQQIAERLLKTATDDFNKAFEDWRRMGFPGLDDEP